MSNANPEQEVAPALAQLSRRTGLLIRALDSAALDGLFDELEKYDSQERAETFDYLKHALNETRTSVGSEPAFCV